jgi:LysM repeat protein
LFAREMTSMIHDSMKPGTDGGVITVSDIDVVKLMSKVDSFRVASLVDSEDTPGQYTVREGDDIIVIAIRLGVSPEDIRKLNGLNPGDVLKPGTVLKIPQ